MKKTLMSIPYFCLWVIYWSLTTEARNRYAMGKMRGMHCYASKDVGMLPGATTEYYYDPSSEPVREYMTWKEFWTEKGY